MANPLPPESPDKAGDDGPGPMDRFKALASSLLKVPYRAVQEERSRYKRLDEGKAKDEGS